MKTNTLRFNHRIALIFSVLLFGMSMNAQAALYKIRLTNITSNGAGMCHETFNINVAGSFTLNNINVKVGGAPTIDDPGRWQIFSPVDASMAKTIFGFSVTTATHKHYEYNTSYHDGPVANGQWELLFDEPTGGCAQYSALLTFDAT